MKKRNILIITYYFPPNKSVGARRWAKFSKYLQRKGHNVVIICSKNPADSTSPWDNDIEGLKINTLPTNYPTFLSLTPKNIIEKIRYKLTVKYLQLITVGAIYDQTLFWEKQLLPLAHQLIEENEIDTVITNGPPFRLMYYCTKLKKSFPNIKLISDFRDPWTWWYNMGYPHLKGRNKSVEAEMERQVVELSDITFTPNDFMQQILMEKYPKSKNFIKVLPHAYDQDEYPTKLKPKTHTDKLNLIYYGTLYNGLADEYRLFAEALIPFKDEVNVDIYSNIFDYKDIFEASGLSGMVNYHKTVPMKELARKIHKYDYAIIISPDFTKNNISTKFFEIINFRIPFLFISQPGKASQFISENQLGIHLKSSEIKENLESIIAKSRSFKYNKTFDVSPYSFDRQTDNILNFINELD